MKNNFPNLKHIEVDDKAALVSFTSKFEIYSDFSFVNLFAWDVDSSSKFAWLNGNLIIQLTDYLARDRTFLTLIGINDIDETLEEIFKYTDHLELVPGFTIDALKRPEIYAIAEDRSSFDYVYDLAELSSLNGKKYNKKRNHINNAKLTLSERLVCETYSEVTGSLMLELMDTFERWREQTSQSFDQTNLESIAIEKLLTHFQFFEIYVTVCRVDGKIQGFSINEVVDDKSAICHFEKAIKNEHEGINTYLINEAAKFLADKAKIVNWEQDLGLDGLKKSKLSYHPIRLNRKYWISNLG